MADRRVPNSTDTQDFIDSQASEAPTIYDSCGEMPLLAPWARLNFVPAKSSVYVGEFDRFLDPRANSHDAICL